MVAIPVESIRNIAICGHRASGKTTLLEHLLLAGGAISRAGTVADGTTVSDFDPLEKSHGHSLDLSCGYLDSEGVRVNLLDTPGYRDFIGRFYCATAAVDMLLVVVSAEEGVQPTTRKFWEVADKLHLPRMVVVNRMDREQADFDRVVAQIQAELSPSCVAFGAPNGAGAAYSATRILLGEAGEAGSACRESIIETNESLMERYLEGKEPAPEELEAAFQEAVATRAVFPILATSAERNIGIAELLSTIVKYAPPASRNVADRKVYKPGHPEESFPLKTGPNDPFCARIFQIVSDPYVGKLTFLRVFSGSLPTGGSFLNPHTNKHEKVGKMVYCQGKEHKPCEAATAGHIVALVKVEGLKTFDVLTLDTPLEMERPPVPTPMCSFAVNPKTKADEKKFAEAIHKIDDEDVTLKAVRDPRTGELIMSGMSQLHLQTLWARLKARYGLEVESKQPKIPYLETISGKGDEQYRHKKQTGGAGEFAEVWLRVEPRERGQGVEFVNEVFGGAIGANYVQSAQKGIQSVLEQGILSGCQIVDLKVTIYDGKEHPVDSKDIAFQKAGREAFKKAFLAAKPILLEPIVNLEVTFPVELMGDIQGDLNRRRGRVQGVESIGSFQVLKALVPLAELADYASSLGSITGGQGSFGIEPAHYEPVPSNVQQQVVEAHKKETGHHHAE